MTTIPLKDQHDLVRLASAANPALAHIWQQALEQEGIRCQVLGDYLDAGLGDIPGLSAEVWVETADLVRAEAILRQHLDAEEVARAEETSEDTSCVPGTARELENNNGANCQ